MRFRRHPRLAYIVTERKCAAARRSQQRQRDAVPLLGTLVAEQQPSIERVMEERISVWDRREQNGRHQRAHDWRRARRILANEEPAIRNVLLQYWNEHRWLPGDPSYLLDMLHGIKTGRLTIARGKVEPARVTISRHEAAQVPLTRKPITRGWVGRRR